MVAEGTISFREFLMREAALSGVVSRWNCRPATRFPIAKAWFPHASLSRNLTAPRGSSNVSPCQ